jgi:hypothetical protein
VHECGSKTGLLDVTAPQPLDLYAKFGAFYVKT